jgi:oligopeptide transport system permease protein
VALSAIVIIFATTLLGPTLYGVDPAHIHEDLIGTPQAPSGAHPAGTDMQGRDLFARLLAGARISLTVGLVSCFINLFIGVGVGVLAGWALATGKRFGSAIDTLLMRGVDVLYSIPLLLVVILMQIFVKPVIESVVGTRQEVWLIFSPDLVSIYLALGVTNWLTMARLARGEVLNQAKLDYVLAAQSLGQRPFWILLRHVLPNCMGPIAVAATLAIPEAIFIESFLGFIGLGVSAPQASWGTMASDALGAMSVSPHQLLFPSLAISVTMLAFNLTGDGLRDALDPSGRR